MSIVSTVFVCLFQIIVVPKGLLWLIYIENMNEKPLAVCWQVPGRGQCSLLCNPPPPRLERRGHWASPNNRIPLAVIFQLRVDWIWVFFGYVWLPFPPQGFRPSLVLGSLCTFWWCRVLQAARKAFSELPVCFQKVRMLLGFLVDVKPSSCTLRRVTFCP